MIFPTDGSVRAPGILKGHRAIALGGPISAAVILHHVPGRLRLSPIWQPDTSRLEAFCAQFEALAGVRAVTPNHVTGSVVINYDPRLLQSDALHAALRANGVELTEDAEVTRPASRHGFLGKLAEAILERLAISLIAAVI